ncbi:response regulator transcription factor [Metabacillus malikii]|uniref:Two-component system response regulator YesN n=1 Tax=Metabacillus malikii TaxID=1504265 RepID=A0ABT9ZCI0_9BACI|nr:response regulator transcription factor [Metabacillus malikii]MDQ0229958.1 two-component system response regulator YesN [Metabacillus malikii]
MLKLFLVDDDRYVRKGLHSLIDWHGCGFEVCAESDNGEDAFEYIVANQPDVVITDIKMPVLDGLELIKKTTETMNVTPSFIILSGYSDFRYAQQAVRYGVHDFLLKPIEKEELEETLIKLSNKLLKSEKQTHLLDNIITTSHEEIVTNQDNLLPELKYRLTKLRRFNYFIIEINNSSVDLIEMKDALYRTVTFEKNEYFLICQLSQSEYGLIFVSSHSTLNHKICDLSEGLQKKLSSHFHNEVSIYVGKTVHEFTKLDESYESAKVAAQYKFLMPSNVPIIFESTLNQSINYTVLNQDLEIQLMELIEEHNHSAIIDTIESIFTEFKNRYFAKSAVRTSINRIVHEVVKTIKTLEGNEKELSTITEMFHWADYGLTLEQLKDLFVKFILEASEQIAQLNKHNASNSIYHVKKYIDRHYHENLTLKEIANIFFMNPVYMGQLFKKTYGIYFKDYYLQLRIEHAKKLLRQTDKKIYEVSESVGFSNPDYFVTQFEKKEGITPSKYRRNHMKNQLERSKTIR